MRNTGRIKNILLVVAIIIAFFFLYISNLLVEDLSVEEKNKIEVWAEAMHTMNMADEDMDMNLVLKVLNANNSIPVIVVDSHDNIQIHRNIAVNSKDSINSVTNTLRKMKRGGKVIRMDYKGSVSNTATTPDYIDIYYDDSTILKKLSVYPYIQLIVVLVFVGVVLFALLSFKKNEQNMVWVGLSKETAHQLGTPISSLMAWLELMKLKYEGDELLTPMSEDIMRLQMIVNRFSKIGASPELERTNLTELLSETINYISGRASNKVEIIMHLPENIVYGMLNSFLFSWVIENLCKNAIDAISGKGQIVITLEETKSTIYIDVADSGRGIPRNQFKSVFMPGYTTKKRGWGLGLSLARRIVEEYHYGRIYVKESIPGNRTTFRIELKK